MRDIYEKVQQDASRDLPEDVILRVSGVSKKFCRNLRRSMWYGIQDLAGNLLGIKADGQNLNVEEKKVPDFKSHRTMSAVALEKEECVSRLRRDEFWALKDISFELKRGECLGLIGRNGCGKTTLLRIIAGIFPPDQGEVAIRGRVGALIALGAGFHPHMTGRENVYLNGAILGLRKSEIDAQFDEIVDFAEIDEFIDAPVSTYSSGMRVRLGFAVATAIKPSLLLVDEILAVGDAQFRSKCYNRIYDICRDCGVILVSHNMQSIARTCNRALLMAKGNVLANSADTSNVIERYQGMDSTDISRIVETPGSHIDAVTINGQPLKGEHTIRFGDPIVVEYDLVVPVQHSDLEVSMTLMGKDSGLVAGINSTLEQTYIRNSGKKMHCTISCTEVCIGHGGGYLSVAVIDRISNTILCWHYGMTKLRVMTDMYCAYPVYLKGSFAFDEQPTHT